MQRLPNPPCQKYQERHPKQRKLDTQINRPCLGQLLRYHRLPPDEMVDYGTEEVHKGDCTVRGEGDDGEEDEAEPFILNTPFFADEFNALNELNQGLLR